MPQPTHTPGPWTIEMEPHSRKTSDGFLSIESALYTICTNVSNCDAALIAAAPDLLDALVALIDCVSVRIDDPRIKRFDAARAAIAKATGVELSK